MLKLEILPMPVVIMECEYDGIVWVTTVTSWWRAEAGGQTRRSVETPSSDTLCSGMWKQWTQPSRPAARCQHRHQNIQSLLELEMNLREV